METGINDIVFSLADDIDASAFLPVEFWFSSGQSVKARSWPKFYDKICCYAFMLCPERFCGIEELDFDGDGRIDVASKSRSFSLVKPNCFADNLYNEMDFDDSLLISKARAFLRRFGFDPADVCVVCRRTSAAVTDERCHYFTSMELERMSEVLSDNSSAFDGKELGPIEIGKFLKYYGGRFGRIDCDEDELRERIVGLGVVRDGLFYCRSKRRDDLISGMRGEIVDLLGVHPVVSSESYFERNRLRLADERIFKSSVFAEFAVESGEFAFESGFFFMDSAAFAKRNGIIRHEIESFFLDSGRSASFESLADTLWFLPITKDALKSINTIFKITDNLYCHIENSPVYEHKDDIRAVIQRKREERPCDPLNVSFIRKALCDEIPYFEDEIREFVNDTYFGFLLRSVFEDEFPFYSTGLIRPLDGKQKNVSGLIREFCINKKEFELEEYIRFSNDRSLNYKNYRTLRSNTILPEACKFLSIDYFIEKYNLTDDKIAEIDGKIESICDREYFSVKYFVPFLFQLPDIGLIWNGFVFEGYIEHVSKKYKLLDPGPPIRNFVGAVVRRSSDFNNIFDIMVDFLAKSSIDLNSSDAISRAFDFFIDSGYLLIRGYKKMPSVIEEACRIRGEHVLV